MDTPYNVSKQNERIAVLEAEKSQLKEDVDRLYEFFRKHMETEERNQLAMVRELADLNLKIDKKWSFVGGVVMAVSGLWGIAMLVLGWFFSKGGS